MKTNYISIITIASSICLLGHQQALSATMPGNLDIGGNLDVQGAQLDLGSWTNDPARPGFSWIYTDNTIAPSTSLWLAYRPSSEWVFKHAGVTQSETYRWVMKLASDHQLFLYENLAVPSNGPTPSIALNPAGASVFKYDLNLNGSKNLMPYQVAPAANDPFFSSAILNFALADARYIRQGTLSFGTGNTVSSNGMAVGANNIASGIGSFAEGQSVRASGNYSVAMGANSLAQGPMSTAIGSSSATGDYSVALGQGTANGSYTTALGFSRASDRYASAFGNSNVSGTCSTAGGASVALGQAATAFGMSTASGFYSTAGGTSGASGQGATAFGISYAVGIYSTATGGSRATGDYSTTSGGSTASADRATALGSATATKSGATAFGYSTASGYGSTASGYTMASAAYATSFGQYNFASGENSTALGFGTTAAGYAQVVLGRYNVPSGNPATWLPADDLLVVGNGTSTAAPSNAFVVKKNGDAVIKGKLDVTGVIRTTAPAGDIRMFDVASQN